MRVHAHMKGQTDAPVHTFLALHTTSAPTPTNTPFNNATDVLHQTKRKTCYVFSCDGTHLEVNPNTRQPVPKSYSFCQSSHKTQHDKCASATQLREGHKAIKLQTLKVLQINQKYCTLNAAISRPAKILTRANIFKRFFMGHPSPKKFSCGMTW